MSDILLQAILDELIKLNVSTRQLVSAQPWADGFNPLRRLDRAQADALAAAHSAS